MIDFSDLYESYGAQVGRFALFLSGNPALAEDIMSETFLRALIASDRIQVATVKAYLFTIARNLYCDWLRHNSRQLPLDESFPDLQPGVQVRTEHKLELEAVLADLQALCEAERAALTMRAADGMTYEEIAQVMGISTGAAKVKVHRARLKLLRSRELSKAAGSNAGARS